MNTAQDIREKVFDRAKFGGYDMAAVDDFLEELAEDVAATQKENAVLKGKMKVLVDKIEEYRANEDAANKVLLSAQKLATQIEDEARARAAAIISAAEQQSKAVIGSITEAKEDEEAKLAAAKEATAAYFEAVRELCTNQLANLDAIRSGYVEEVVEEVAEEATEEGFSIDEAVRSIEDSIARIQPETSVDVDIDIPATQESEDEAFSF